MLIIGQQPIHTGHDALIRSLIRRGKTDVLLVPKISTRQINKILVAVDFSGCSEKLVEMASYIAHSSQKPMMIQFLHVNSASYYMKGKTHQKYESFSRGINRAFKNLVGKFTFPATVKLDFLELPQESSLYHQTIVDTALNESSDLST